MRTLGEVAGRLIGSGLLGRYWRGEYPLITTFWIFGPAILVVAVLILAAARIPLADPRIYEPSLFFWAVVISWSALVALSIWQLGGVWRSATHHIEAAGRAGRAAPWAKLAKLTVFAGMFSLAAQLSAFGVPQIRELTRMAFLGDPALPDYAIRIMRDGTEIEISGGIKYGVASDLRRIMRHAPARVVHLDSPGGRIGEAFKLHRVIREHDLATYVSGRCMSACTLAFAGGSRRWLDSHAALGFHRPDFPGIAAFDLNRAQSAQQQLFASAGFDSAFIERALSTPNRDMWTPSVGELLRAGAVTDIADGKTFAVSGFGATADKPQLAAKLAEKLPVLDRIARQYPDTHDAIIDEAFEAYLTEEPLVAFNAAIRRRLLPIVERHRSMASDDVLVDMAALASAQYSALGEKDPYLCFSYVAGTDSGRNFSYDLPRELVQWEVALSDRIMESSARPVRARQRDLSALWAELLDRIADRIGPKDLDLLWNMSPNPDRYADFCDAWTVFFDELSKMDSRDAAPLMRQILNAGPKGQGGE